MSRELKRAVPGKNDGKTGEIRAERETERMTENETRKIFESEKMSDTRYIQCPSLTEHKALYTR
jgi:hypothetical protein